MFNDKRHGCWSDVPLQGLVGLLMPHIAVDGRLFKLVIRLLQRASVDSRALWFEAKRERADRVLYWLVQQVPEVECVGCIPSVIATCPGEPRGYRGLMFNYDGNRLIRRPATKESVWRAARR